VNTRTILMPVLVALVVACSAIADLPKLVKKEYTYKEVADIEIKADVYRFEDAKERPVVVWYHGGGLVNGTRANPHKELYDHCERQGYILVSFDYRLAPEVKLSAILEDIKDGIKWIREQGPGLFQADPNRLVVTGSSDGGYLALMAGAVVVPAPNGVISFWGYGDVDGKWYLEPSKYFTLNIPPVSKKDALSYVGKKVYTCTSWDEDARQRNDYYIYLRQTGEWTKAVTGIDPKLHPRKLLPYDPIRNIKSTYPPTLLIHGREDGDVPFRKAEEMAQALSIAGITNELIGIDKGMHALRGGDKEQRKIAREKMKKFITDNLTKE